MDGALLICSDRLVLQSRFFRPIDRDAFGFRFFRNHPQQLDIQQTVAQFGGLDFDVVRQTERQFEGALCDAPYR